MTNRHDPKSFRFGRAPSPEELSRWYANPGTVVAIFPLIERPALVVVLLNHWRRYAAIPAAIYDVDGIEHYPPIIGLEPTSRPDLLAFRWQIKPIRPLRSARDMYDLAENWVYSVVDKPPTNSQFVPVPTNAKDELEEFSVRRAA